MRPVHDNWRKPACSNRDPAQPKNKEISQKKTQCKICLLPSCVLLPNKRVDTPSRPEDPGPWDAVLVILQ